ncbi:hypothetical protein [Maricaulis sp.]|uniref:hypothetical protein n=1 Tax=Maricaulis sp. TaxID=1486257 RepID=UPI0026319AB4|nr:hypothetical protein [Maricaulis sp.]
MRHQLNLTTIIALGVIATGPATVDAQDRADRTQDLRSMRAVNAQISNRVSTLATLQPARTATPDNPRIMPIDWDQVRADVRAQNARDANFTATARLVQRFPQPQNDQAIQANSTRLPVLMPSRTSLGLAEEPVVLLFPQEDFFTISITGPDILIEVFGTRLAHARAPDPVTLRRLRTSDGDGLRITRTEYGAEANFSRYGAAYSVTVECDNPETDPRCTQADYVRGLALNLGIVAGSPDEGE